MLCSRTCVLPSWKPGCRNKGGNRERQRESQEGLSRERRAGSAAPLPAPVILEGFHPQNSRWTPGTPPPDGPGQRDNPQKYTPKVFVFVSTFWAELLGKTWHSSLKHACHVSWVLLPSPLSGQSPAETIREGAHMSTVRLLAHPGVSEVYGRLRQSRRHMFTHTHTFPCAGQA